MKRNAPQVFNLPARRYGPNESAEVGCYEPGDFILTHRRDLVSELIRVGQRMRFRGSNRKYAYWSHAAVIVSAQGHLVEAEGRGVIRSTLEKYRAVEYTLVSLGPTLASPHDREQVVAFANWCVGQKYNYLTVAALALSLVLGVGAKLSIGYDGEAICSGLVARALERTSVIFDREAAHIMPADLARYFRVEPQPRSTVQPA